MYSIRSLLVVHVVRRPLMCVALAFLAAPPLARSAGKDPPGTVRAEQGCGGNTARSALVGLCGDGKVDVVGEYSEDCDPGSAGLIAAATAEHGMCTDICKIAKCGDGVSNEDEKCDDGDGNVPAALAGAGVCTDACEFAVCGDGVKNKDEACDDGNDTPEDGCERDCKETVCAEPGTCGNGMPECGEACDDGNQEDTDACLSSCEDAKCGDGFVWSSKGGSEACDDGNDVTGDGCEPDCTVTPGMAVCGNGDVEQGEGCDDGNMEDGDACPSGPKGGCKQAAACGDGIVWTMGGPEMCDDGNAEDADDCPSGAVGQCKEVARCGDGIVWTLGMGMEACDSGGVQTSGCEVDCVLPVCGDWVVNMAAGEVCEDGNMADGDGCSGDCAAFERRVFVTSVRYQGDMDFAEDNPMQLSGMDLADARCQGLAEAAGLSGMFKAWLSDDETSPAARFDTRFMGVYRLGSEGFPVVAAGWEDLTDGELMHSIDANESGMMIDEDFLVWTNTDAAGQSATAEHCSGWTMTAGTSVIGDAGSTGEAWTDKVSGQFCEVAFRIYCFEDN